MGCQLQRFTHVAIFLQSTLHVICLMRITEERKQRIVGKGKQTGDV